MTHSCKDNHGDIRANIRQPFNLRVEMTKRASVKSRVKGQSELRSRLAVVYGGFAEELFGSMFGSSGSSNRGLNPKPQFLAKTMKFENSIKQKSTSIQIKRSINNISELLFDVTSQNYINYGIASVPESLYEPLTANNSTKVYSKGPVVEWNLRTARKNIPSNSKFTSRANKPISNFSVKIQVNGNIKSKKFEKLHGHFKKILDIDGYLATDKLYPIRDIVTEKGGISFVTERAESSGIYRSIDEGTHVGNIVQNKQEGYPTSDDRHTYITPSSIYTEGNFTYKCEVTPPSITPLDSFFFMRAAAPIFNQETDVPPVYEVSNIKLEDPSGNLIVKYKDFKITGQQDYEKKNQFHYITYVSEPEENLTRLETYHSHYPVLGEASGYTLSLDIKGDCKYRPFTDNFNKGFEHTCNLDDRFIPSSPNDYLSFDGKPLSTQTDSYMLRPNYGLRISAIELDNRGIGDGILTDGKLPLHLQTVETGTLLERTLKPIRVLPNDYTNNIYPTNTNNIWKTSPDIDGNIYYSNNKDSKTVQEFNDRLNNFFVEGHITLHETQPVQESGKLQLLFEHKRPVSVLAPVKGDFNFGTKAWSKADYDFIYSDDSTFEVEEIYLSIVARKEQNTPDFPIDVVGYSDDKVLVQTDQVGGFLQNTNGTVGDIPNASGFFNINELALSAETLSDRAAYYDKDVTDSPAGDHYIIDSTVVVDSTDFKQYTVPLTLYEKQGELGPAKKFTNSKFFEALYLDIYPIPSGASFQAVNLIIKYKPASSLQMFTLGYETKKLWNTDTRIHPEKFYLAQDHYANKLFSDSTYLSQIDNIPHAYQVYEDTLKTNYSRRWRGSSGSVFGGPFDATEFDFSFENPQFNQPFLLGYYDFHNIDNDAVYSSIGATQYSGVFNSNLESSIIENRGMRFQSDHLFSSQHNAYKSIDWTYDGSEIQGQIIDSFDKAVRVSGVDGYLNFGNVPTSSGFALYTRFSPDVTVSGANYNLWDNGVIASKWDNGQDLEYALYYENGNLTASARDNNGSIIKIKDSVKYHDYIFPMSALVTYNAGGDNKMRLYTYNERGNTLNTLDWQKLRGESSPFVLHSGNSDLTLGYSSGSGVGFNAFISEAGLSHIPWSGGTEGSLNSDDLAIGRGIIGSSENVSYQVDSADSFFAGHSLSFGLNESDNNPLWRFVDEDTDSWQLGAFKYCDFNLDFDVMKLRVGRDYIYHKFYNDGSEYQDIIDINLPTSLAHASGLAYHSQVENDMLRFHLGGLENRYFSAPPRLSKRFPRGYVVDGDAFRINTVIQHDSNADILWPDGNKGAKLIVSLYAPSKESELFPTENYGLVNRQAHYLNPEDCWNKITTELTISDIKDSESEPWSYFNRDVIDQELKENYFSKDVDQMFIQYDLAYPSGNYSWSEIKIHSLDVSLKEALLEEEKASNELWIYASGEAYKSEHVDLYTTALGIADSDMWLYASGAAFIESSGKMPLMTSGTYEESADLNLYSITIGNWPPQSFGSEEVMFGSQEDVSDPYRNHVKLLLPFDGSLNDISTNNYSPSLIEPYNDFFPLSPGIIRAYPEFSTTSVFGSGKSANFYSNLDSRNDWNYRLLEYSDLSFDAGDADGDWVIDFWYYQKPPYETGYDIPAGGTSFYNSPIFMWGGYQQVSGNEGGIGASSNSALIGMWLFWHEGRLELKIGLNSTGLEPAPTDRNDPNSGWGPDGIYRPWNNDYGLELQDEWEEFGAYAGVIACRNHPFRPEPHYNTDFEGYEDIKDTWAKFIIRKIGTVIQIFVNEEKVGQADIGRLRFNGVIPDLEYDPPEKLPLQISTEPMHNFFLDDFRITMGSARSSDANTNPTTSWDAVINGLSASSPAPARDPSIVPPPTTTAPPVNVPSYIFPLYVNCSPEYENSTLDLVVDSFSPNATSINSSVNLNVYDITGDTYSGSINTFTFCDDVVSTASIGSESAGMSLITTGPEFVTFNETSSLPLLSLGRPIYDTLFGNMGMHTYNKKPIGQVGTYLESYTWNGNNYGLSITPADEKYTSVSPLDEIRGVNTVCYGGCQSSAFLKCTEQDLETHDVIWYSPECVDGGVIRSFTTYTNDSVPAFGSLTETYNNHYYGIRKFSNLIPKAPYSVLVIAETGDAEILEVPREITEWEYGTSRIKDGEVVPEVAYSGLKLTAEDIIPSGNFGYGLTAHRDMVIVGNPQEDITLGMDDYYNSDDENYVLKNAGKIYVYQKDSEPTGADWTDQDDKAKFILQQQLVLPTGFRRDAYSSSFKRFPGVDAEFQAEVKQWYNIGEGRELGHSLDSASRGDKDILIAGGPGTMWSRKFEPVTPYPVQIGMIIFNNELVSDPPGKTWRSILEELEDRDILFRYFCDPPVVFDIKIMLLEPVLGGPVEQESSLEFEYPQPDFITRHKVHRHYSYRVDTQDYKDRDALMYNELVDIFQETFPLTANTIHSGLPPLLGIYIDDSRSLGTQAVGYYDNGLREGALNKFIDFYKQYTYDNGVLNAPVYGDQAAEGYVQVTKSVDEDWIAQGIQCLKNLTDIPTLNSNNAFRLLGNDLGKFNNDDSEFNLLPPSGGAVFVFEKDKDASNFELVQYIDSPVTYNNDYSDRFGHDVAISDDGKTLVIGSPYSDHAVQIWQYDKHYETTLDSYIQNVYISYLSIEYAREVSDATFGEAFNLYKEWQEKSVDTIFTKTLKQELWNKSSDSLKFRFLENYDVHPYFLNKEIQYSDIYSGTGSWDNLYNNIPTSRMGYSVDTNSDGSLVAIGCPTDSMGERDAAITWFRYGVYSEQTQYGGENWEWQNYVNAGAVRLLESRDYYPHSNKVVEFYAFGNLHESLSDPEDEAYFLPSMSGMYAGMGYDFRRTVYNEELVIPEDAGLAFIITPEISFQSDEVINNIKDWLAKGDRNLVLVGNDPLYEAGGAYSKSNNIINYILEQLDIKMRLYPARDAEESLVNPSTDLYYNVRQSTVPSKTMSPIGQFKGLKLKGYGVADIRFFDSTRSDLYHCTETTAPPSDSFSLIGMPPKANYRELHDRCELPIITEGDLRAKYWDQCEYRTCKGEVIWYNYQHNLGYMYGSHRTDPDWLCGNCEKPAPPTPHSNLRDNSEPIPMFAAYEQLTKTIVVPPVPDSVVEKERVVGYTYSGETTYSFPEESASYSGIAFMWSEASGNYDSLVYNINNISSKSEWFNPAEYDGKDAVLQAKLSSSLNSFEENYIVEHSLNFIAEEKLTDNSGSSVVLIAGTATERSDVLLNSLGDININLYFNLLAKNEYGESKVAQVGGFTQRDGYKSGFKDSGIQSIMTSLNIDMSNVNVELDDLRQVGNGYDVAWIANTDQMPSSDDINRLKQFLALGNKKIIITYGKNPSGEANEIDPDDSSAIDSYYIRAANVAKHICQELGLTMEPLFLEGKNRYASLQDSESSSGRTLNSMEVRGSLLQGFDSASDFIVNGRSQNFDIQVEPCSPFGGCMGYFHDIIPIKTNSAEVLAFFDMGIKDIRAGVRTEPQLRTGITRVVFDVPDKEDHHDDFNLFRLHITSHIDTYLESEGFDVYVSNCSANVSLENTNSGSNTTIYDYGDDGSYVSTPIRLGKKETIWGEGEKTFNIQIPKDVEQIELFIHANETYPEAEIGSDQDYSNNRTVKLFAVSGVRIPVKQTYHEDREEIKEKYYETVPGRPEYSYEQFYTREISHNSQQYCEQAAPGSEICAEEPILGYGSNVRDIEDGPVVIAQEVYHQAGYFVGVNKSRVTIISDPSLIQGSTIKAEGLDSANADLATFLGSLYPRTRFPNQTAGRQYPNFFKIISPERSSPSRLINAYPDNSGLNYRFGGYESNNLPANVYSDTEGEKQILPIPPQDFVYSPFDEMLPIDKVTDMGKFRKEAISPQKSIVESYREQGNYAAIDALYQAWYIDNFETVQAHYGSKTKFHDIVDGVVYKDAGYQERIPPVLRATGRDHLDFSFFGSGYPGDLFGYKVTIHEDKLYVGSPFTPYNETTITKWDDVISNGSTYGTEVGYNGGAGAVYVIGKVGPTGDGAGSTSLEKTTGLPWDVVQKIRPERLSVGFSGINAADASGIYGNHSYTDEFLQANAHKSDMFGYDISLDSDVMAISAPNHSFDVFYEHTSGNFIRKEFNEQFNIPQVIPHDLATPSERATYLESGVSVINHGSVFTYENRIADWGTKQQTWDEIHKITTLGSGTRIQNAQENIMFGSNIELSRAKRNDGDYILAVGATHEDVSNVEDAGAVFAYDAMLRKLRPSFPHPETYIAGRVYGDGDLEIESTNFNVANGITPNSQVYIRGRVVANAEGEIFIEASGQDKLDRGYVTHRPYIKAVRGSYLFGRPIENDMNLFTDSINVPESGTLPLISFGPEQYSVYNKADLFCYSAVHNSGITHLYTSGVPSDYYGSYQTVSEQHTKEDVDKLQDIRLSNTMSLVARGGPPRVRRK